MTCKYCGLETANWPENYTPGCRMVESDTGLEHTFERCQEIKNPHSKSEPRIKKHNCPYPDRKGWVILKCYQCKNDIRISKKWYKPKPGDYICNDCSMKNFNRLDNFDITL